MHRPQFRNRLQRTFGFAGTAQLQQDVGVVDQQFRIFRVTGGAFTKGHKGSFMLLLVMQGRSQQTVSLQIPGVFLQRLTA